MSENNESDQNLPEINPDLTVDELRQFASRCINRGRGEFGRGVLYAIEKFPGIDVGVKTIGVLDTNLAGASERERQFSEIIALLAVYEDGNKMRKQSFLKQVNEILEDG